MNSGSHDAQRETFSLLNLSRLTRNASLVAIKKTIKKRVSKSDFFRSLPMSPGVAVIQPDQVLPYVLKLRPSSSRWAYMMLS